jgi:asparagine synthase (glutamine-hydrolysing)
MCGIAGFWKTKAHRECPQETLRQMGATMAHRGPDDSGVFFDAGAGLGLVHRRLAILDLSPEGHQPMTSVSGRYVIVFNGEVYNFEAIREELGAAKWRGHSDTEVMLQAFERWGIQAAVRRFVGMFAFALWDAQDKILYLVRDRLGIKPLYYGRIGTDFVFASELKALREYPGFDNSIDLDALALYMRHDYVPSPHSIYTGIQKLRPGQIACFQSPRATPAMSTFWSAIDVAQRGAAERLGSSESELLDQLEQCLSESVRLRMIADVPVGAFLSGGVDSSTVVALMQRQSSRPVRTFTIGFQDPAFDEAKAAQKVAQHLGTEHTELYVTPEEAQAVIPLLPSMYDEPFGDSSQIPTFLVSRLARRQVTVSLSGDGGDELFGGYFRYSLTNSLWRLLRNVPRPARRIAERLTRRVPPKMIDTGLSWIRPVLPARITGIRLPGDKLQKIAEYLPLANPEAIYLHTLSHWSNACQLVPGAAVPNDLENSLAELRGLPSFDEIMMLADLTNYLPDDILTKVDRASMAVSLEARVPLLDHRAVELAWRMPVNFKVRNGQAKWALRQILYKYVPARLIERPKMGFNVPVDGWLRGPLRPWAEELLSQEALGKHQLLNIEMVRKKWKEHLSGSRNWHFQLWNVLMFQQWLTSQRSPARVANAF